MPQEPLRVLRIAADIYPDIMGGAAIHAHEMSNLQSDMGHEVTVLTSDHGDDSLPRQEDRNYGLYRSNEWFNLFGNSISPNILRKIRKFKNEVDIIHAHSHLTLATNLAALNRRLDETPLVITNHGLFSQTAPKLVQKVYMPTIARFTLNTADRILCYTKTDQQRLNNRGITTPISVIHNGIDCSVFRPLKSVEQKNQLLFVGRLKESKGVLILLKAFIRLSDDIQDLRLKIVGDGPLRDRLQSKSIEAGVSDRVIFPGKVPNDDLSKIYNESRVLILPSSAEGLPRTILEALACETPVITSRLPQLVPVVEDVGFSVPRTDVDELCHKIRTIVSNESLRNQMGSKGRKRVQDQYSWEETVIETTNEYYDLI